jgi:DNA-binding transcriptional MerR regulator
MVTLDEVARFLGLSKRAVRLRVDALGDMLEGYLSRGDRNRLIFRGEAVAILRRLEELRREEGLPIREAADRLRGELGDGDATSGVFIVIRPQVEMDLVQELLQDMSQERDQWREYALALQSVLPPELKWLHSVAPTSLGDRRLN